MSWNNESAANDLERYILRGEIPAMGSVELAIRSLRRNGSFFWLECDGCRFVEILGETIKERKERLGVDRDPCQSCSRMYLDNFQNKNGF